MTPETLRILLLDARAGPAGRVAKLLESIPEVRYQIDRAKSADAIPRPPSASAPDACVVGSARISGETLELIRHLASLGPARPPVIVIGASRPPQDREAMAAGADDYLDEATLDAGALDRAIRHALQRRRTLQELQEKETYLNLALSTANVGFWDRNLATDAIYLAPETLRLLGREAAPATSSQADWIEAVHPDDRTMLDHATRQLLDGAVPMARVHFRMRGQDGAYRWFQGRTIAVRDEQGRPLRLIGTVLDVTQRMTDEAQLREQAALLDNANDIIVVRDLQHRYLYCNKSAARTLGLTPEQIEGHTTREVLGELPAEFLEAFHQVQAHGEWHGEIAYPRQNAQPLLVESRWTLLRDDAGRPKAVLSINTDITERKQLEGQYLRAQRMESIGLLAGGIAHDLNNVLAPIVMGAQLLRLRHPDATSQKLLGTVEASAQRGADLVRQVLTFARGIEGGRLLVHPRSLAKDVQKLAVETFDKSIEVTGRIESDLWPVPGDPTQLRQLLVNLCVNARDAMPRGGRLTLTARNAPVDENYAAMTPDLRPGPYVLFEVQDTGVGMSPEVRRHVFEPFFTTKAPGKGTGLGLSTAQTIVHGHGGVITFESEEGRGTTFKVFLPASSETAVTTATSALTAPRGSGETILLVDDEASVLNISRHALEAFGYQVLTASNGAEALALYAQKRDAIAVVLTDMAMPVLDGAALIYALRRIDPAVRIIAASGLKASAHSMEPFGLGTTHFLAKPFTADTMLRAIHESLTGAAPAAGGATAP